MAFCKYIKPNKEKCKNQARFCGYCIIHFRKIQNENSIKNKLKENKTALEIVTRIKTNRKKRLWKYIQ